jgi:hypothetical protein
MASGKTCTAIDYERNRMDLGFKDKTALVPGGGGLGSAIARTLRFLTWACPTHCAT